MNLFVLEAILRLNKDEFNQGTQEATSQGVNMGQKLEKVYKGAAAAFKTIVSAKIIKDVATGLWDMANSAASAGDHIAKTAQQMGISSRAYQEWSYIMGQNGADIDAMNLAFANLNNTLINYRSSSQETRNAFKALGLNMRELAEMPLEDAFDAIVTAFQELPDGTQKSSLAMQVFGRAGQQLIPMLNSTAESTEALRENAHEMGIVLDDEAIANAEAFGDAMDDLNKTMEGAKNKLGSSMHPALTQIVKDLTMVSKDGVRGATRAWDDLWSAFDKGYKEKGRTSGLGILTGIGSGLGKMVEKSIANTVDTTINMILPDEEKQAQIKADVDLWWSRMEQELDLSKEMDVTPPSEANEPGIKTAVDFWWQRMDMELSKEMDVDPPSETNTQTLATNIGTWWDTFKVGLGLKADVEGVNPPSETSAQSVILKWWDEVKKSINLTIGFDILPTSENNQETVLTQKKVIRPSTRQGTDWTTKNQQGHAIGLANVPYDGYPAILHKNERVLTSLENMQYTAEKNSLTRQAVDYSAMADTIAGAVAEAVSSIEIGLDGRAITNRVSKSIAAKTRQRRYAKT